MNYGISESKRKEAIEFIENESLKEQLNVLKNQINFLTDTEKPLIENTTFSSQDAKVLNEDMSKINECLDVLNFKKESLQVGLDDYLSNINISEAVKTKAELMEIDKQLETYNGKRKDLDDKIKLSKEDFDVQMLKIRKKYDNVDVINDIVDNEFSSPVVYEYKKERARKIANQFLDSLTPEKRQQLLLENKEIYELINVGENI